MTNFNLLDDGGGCDGMWPNKVKIDKAVTNDDITFNHLLLAHFQLLII